MFDTTNKIALSEINKCTFSRANGPRVSISSMDANPHKPYYQMLENRSLYSKLAQENENMNKDNLMDETLKTTKNNAYRSYQKSLHRLQ